MRETVEVIAAVALDFVADGCEALGGVVVGSVLRVLDWFEALAPTEFATFWIVVGVLAYLVSLCIDDRPPVRSRCDELEAAQLRDIFVGPPSATDGLEHWPDVAGVPALRPRDEGLDCDDIEGADASSALTWTAGDTFVIGARGGVK